ncbi:MAG: hypothetical protein JSW60_06110 [Thermoplasmatales archaeon]|nr:MAG: hypothetical protein JSW60_06110 [Thermoplasmatales archaeon]
MKQLLLVLGICFLLAIMPMTTAISMPKLSTEISKTENKLKNYSIVEKPSNIGVLDEPPNWANGNFSGEWGLNLLGIPVTPLGWMEGYYQNIGFGRLEGVFAEFNETATGKISGIMLYVFFLGGVEDIATGNGTFVSGIGVANETHFYWRISAIIGPSFYIYCEYTKFE